MASDRSADNSATSNKEVKVHMVLLDDRETVRAAQEVFAEMQAHGILQLDVGYSGSGDEGDFYSHPVDPRHGRELPEVLDVTAMEVAAQAVDARHSGWENCDGGHGVVMFRLTQEGAEWISTIEVDHYDNCTDSEIDTIHVFAGDEEDDLGEGDVFSVLSGMKEHGIAQIHVEYNGGGDSGDISDVSALIYDEAGEVQPHPQGEVVLSSLRDVVDGVVHNQVWAHHWGWWNNEGGAGEVFFSLRGGDAKNGDAKGPVVYAEHRNYIQEADNDNYRFYTAVAG